MFVEELKALSYPAALVYNKHWLASVIVWKLMH